MQNYANFMKSIIQLIIQTMAFVFVFAFVFSLLNYLLDWHLGLKGQEVPAIPVRPCFSSESVWFAPRSPTFGEESVPPLDKTHDRMLDL